VALRDSLTVLIAEVNSAMHPVSCTHARKKSETPRTTHYEGYYTIRSTNTASSTASLSSHLNPVSYCGGALHARTCVVLSNAPAYIGLRVCPTVLPLHLATPCVGCAHSISAAAEVHSMNPPISITVDEATQAFGQCGRHKARWRRAHKSAAHAQCGAVCVRVCVGGSRARLSAVSACTTCGGCAVLLEVSITT